jgi:predicted alpha/beta hydrolase
MNQRKSFGNVANHCPPDPNGFWINRGAAEALNAKDAEEMRNGFAIAIFNSRGVHWVDPSGKPEMELSAKYKKQAEDAENAGYQRLATTMRGVADSYANEEKRIIDEAKRET